MKKIDLPLHLKKYVIEQNYSQYTWQDQAVWRHILHQLRDYLSEHAHSCYLDGLEKTGIELERIPHVSDISEKLSHFGWQAVTVSGFIPPAAFMEFQSLGILPIATHMRSLEHMFYTPAPDIVHESAGHAPILINTEFASYLKKYAEVAKKAVISREDLALYKAIRELSDIKENPDSKQDEILQAEKKLSEIVHSMSHVSEAQLLGRMNWWTAEYGLIGDIENPQIYGAGLLSSIEESRSCLGPTILKKPFSIECLNYSYDITEPQPQLFVATNFSELSRVLDEFAQSMAYQRGGLESLEKALKAETVNSVELNSGIQISGVLNTFELDSEGEVAFVRFVGPVQLAFKGRQLKGHDQFYHHQGFSTPLGILEDAEGCLSLMSTEELGELGIEEGHDCTLYYSSGLVLKGRLLKITKQQGRIILLTFKDCLIEWEGRVLYEPQWGDFDLAVGYKISAVFAGAADREAYGDSEDFVSKPVSIRKLSAKEERLDQLYKSVRDVREGRLSSSVLSAIEYELRRDYPQEWLLFHELNELRYRPSVEQSRVAKTQSFDELSKV